MQLVRAELPRVRVRGGVQGLSHEVLPVGREAILQPVDRDPPGEQRGELRSGTPLQHGSHPRHPEAAGHLVGGHDRSGGDRVRRETVVPRPPVHLGCRRRGRVVRGVVEHPVPLREVDRHGEVARRRCLPPRGHGGGDEKERQEDELGDGDGGGRKICRPPHGEGNRVI
jgi:hypothetical protein